MPARHSSRHAADEKLTLCPAARHAHVLGLPERLVDWADSHALRALLLAALDAEFIGSGNGNWPSIVRRLAAARQVQQDAVRDAELLWAFGTLMGNTDMHNGNLSFIAGHGRPYQLAPAYDMTCMGFRPTDSGRMQNGLAAAVISPDVSNGAWRLAQELARNFLQRVTAETRFSARFAPCVSALVAHADTAAGRIGRLG